jgi:hypothetical protein
VKDAERGSAQSPPRGVPLVSCRVLGGVTLASFFCFAQHVPSGSSSGRIGTALQMSWVNCLAARASFAHQLRWETAMSVFGGGGKGAMATKVSN